MSERDLFMTYARSNVRHANLFLYAMDALLILCLTCLAVLIWRVETDYNSAVLKIVAYTSTLFVLGIQIHHNLQTKKMRKALEYVETWLTLHQDIVNMRTALPAGARSHDRHNGTNTY